MIEKVVILIVFFALYGLTCLFWGFIYAHKDD